MEGLASLTKLAPPPKSPTAAKGDWAAVEADLGKKLPPDWKALVGRYGYGQFADFLHVFSPFFAPCTMMSHARGMLDADRELKNAVPEAVPFALYPEKDGALPWAQSDNGDAVYWITRSGDPSKWPVAVWNPRGGRLEMFERRGGATAFLHRWLSGKDRVRGFPEDARPTFDRWLERAHATVQIKTTNGASYEERLARLLAALGPTVERRGEFGDDEKRQVHFVTHGGDFRFTYDTVYGHNVRIAAPKDRLDELKATVASVFRSQRRR